MTKLKIIDYNDNKNYHHTSTIKFDHYHNREQINFNKEAEKIIKFIKKNCSYDLYQAIILEFHK